MSRLRGAHHEPLHEPRACRRCWAVCRNTPQEGRRWCADCERAAADCGDPRVICWLDDLTEPPTTPEELIDNLTTGI